VEEEQETVVWVTTQFFTNILSTSDCEGLADDECIPADFNPGFIAASALMTSAASSSAAIPSSASFSVSSASSSFSSSAPPSAPAASSASSSSAPSSSNPYTIFSFSEAVEQEDKVEQEEKKYFFPTDAEADAGAADAAAGAAAGDIDGAVHIGDGQYDRYTMRGHSQDIGDLRAAVDAIRAMERQNRELSDRVAKLLDVIEGVGHRSAAAAAPSTWRL